MFFGPVYPGIGDVSKLINEIFHGFSIQKPTSLTNNQQLLIHRCE